MTCPLPVLVFRLFLQTARGVYQVPEFKYGDQGPTWSTGAGQAEAARLADKDELR